MKDETTYVSKFALKPSVVCTQQEQVIHYCPPVDTERMAVEPLCVFVCFLCSGV